MQYTPNKQRLSKLDLSGFKIGDSVLFCTECDWQSNEQQAMVNMCPDCGERGLSISTVDDDLVELVNTKLMLDVAEEYTSELLASNEWFLKTKAE